MKKTKIALWAIILVCILLFFLHNQEFFMAKTAFDINILGISSLATYSKVFEVYKTPELPNVIIFLAFFGLGIAVMYLLGLATWFKSARTIRRLSNDYEALTARNAELEKELEEARRGTMVADRYSYDNAKEIDITEESKQLPPVETEADNDADSSEEGTLKKKSIAP